MTVVSFGNHPNYPRVRLHDSDPWHAMDVEMPQHAHWNRLAARHAGGRGLRAATTRTLVSALAVGLLVSGCGAVTTRSTETVSGTHQAATPPASQSPAATRGCGPANGHEPVDPVVAPRTPRPIGRPVVADVDGDGRRDVAQLYGGWHSRYGAFDRVVVRLASGRLVSGADIADDDPTHPLTRLLGSADVNGDGRSELVLETPGNTLSGAQIVTLVGNGLLTATSCEHDPYDGYYREPDVTFGAHSNGCIPWCMVATKCMRVAGQPRVVTVEGATHNRDGDLTIHRLYWTATAYRLIGADLVKVATYHGSARSMAALPRAWPFGNDLSCGTAYAPEGT